MNLGTNLFYLKKFFSSNYLSTEIWVWFLTIRGAWIPPRIETGSMEIAWTWIRPGFFMVVDTRSQFFKIIKNIEIKDAVIYLDAKITNKSGF